MNHHPQYSGIAKALAAHGRNGDTELLHVSKSELAALNAAGAPAGIRLTKNPETGLYEAFNWMGTLGGVAGGIIGGVLSAGNPMGVAAGASLGAGLGTAAGGGSTNQILTSAVISGIGGYVGGGGLGSLAEAGETELAKQAVEQGGSQVAQDVAGGSITQEAFKNIPSETLAKTTEAMTANNVSGEAQAQALNNMNATYGAQNASLLDKVTAGWKAAPGMFGGQGDALMKTGVAALGVGAINPGSSQIVTPQTGSPTSTANPYKAEIYYTPDGQKRTRVVKAARGGAIYGDYDGVEEAQADDGYMAGGTTYMASGGSTAAAAAGARTPTDKGNPANALYRNSAFDVYAEDLNTPINAGNRTRVMPNVLAKGFFTKEDYDRATPEEQAEMRALESAKQEMVPSPTRRQTFSAAEGGIARFNGKDKSDIDVTDLESPAAKYVRRLEARGMPIVDKHVKGGAGRMGYNFPVGEDSNLNLGLSGAAMRTDFPGSDPVTRGQISGVDATYSMPGRSVSARYDAMAPTVTPSNLGPMDAQTMMRMGPAPMARDKFSVNYRQEFADGGGIGDLGGYSDGGRLLKGPGDGVSDSIPASIENKQPARLADGEFVVPARAVSELGNGSTEAGSKQLYKMLDRIAAKRKSGKGLAYESNPKKLLPA